MKRMRVFLKQVAERIGSVVANPMFTLWDSDKRQRERRDRERDY